MIAAFAEIGPERLQLWAARKAADRGLHGIALRSAPDDPYVLSALGLFPQALAGCGSDRKAMFGQWVAKVAMEGDLLDSGGAASLPDAQRRRLASALAPSNPGLAAEILPGNARAARIACLLAAGSIEAAAEMLAMTDNREFHLLDAHIALSRGEYRKGRNAWNAAFAVDGLGPALADEDMPVAADDFHAPTIIAEDGPKISVVVPFKDAAGTLGQAIEALCAQSWRNIEILAVDDGSHDESLKIAKDLAERDSRVFAFENGGAAGVYGARNHALARATGMAVTFLDADDWSPPERLARQFAALDGGATVSIANHVRIDRAGRPVAPRVFPLARPVPITMMLRRDTMHEIGMFEEVATGADSEYLGRLQTRFGRKAIDRDPAVLLVARWRSGSLSEARDGGMLGESRYAYRGEWMRRHAGLGSSLASLSPTGLDMGDERRPDD